MARAKGPGNIFSSRKRFLVPAGWMAITTANLNGSSRKTSNLTRRSTDPSGFLHCKPFKGWRTLSDPVTMSSTTEKPLSRRSTWHCVVWNVHISSLVSPFPLQPPQLTFKNRAILSLLYVWESGGFFSNEKRTSKSWMIFYLRISLKQNPLLLTNWWNLCINTQVEFLVRIEGE